MARYNSQTKEGNCTFCEIAQKKRKPLGNGLIWEDENYMAWVSPFPNTIGFTVVIPKKHSQSDVLQLDDYELSTFVLAAKKVSNLLLKSFEDVGRIGLIMEGTGINHVHIKLVPMHGTEFLQKGEWKQVSSNNNSFYEEYKGFITSNDGPKADLEELEKLAKKIRELK